ncbi:MAG: tRNA (adenosine(37)-N6)-threonylcarbamoyltransferase complex dimerization subunit type 1 TsaB [Bacteroidia bacterium]|nr:tRNA (adenosine(37)-N6)-threonylcarbamoyltransferase complex dimerization subunit type 1 TsaB [Bacteroidia bacterium]HQU99798.1 tRNA (adenosine(37)-N6)-threonylcarbamoyltransferase complex dimerization subunit type 1 TsaB [Bacteroidia bacterium]
MATILHIETATPICSVVLASNKIILSEALTLEPRSHGSQLQAMVQQVLDTAGLTFHNLDAIAISKGPGSYTGLRIGVSAAKGYCYALNIPLIAINTLQAYAIHCINTLRNEQRMPEADNNLPMLFVPMIDARRMEVYTAIFNVDGVAILPTQAMILTTTSFADLLTNNNLVFFGDGATKWQTLAHTFANAFFVETPVSAVGMVQLAMDKLKAKDVENTAYFEPFYLKEFYTPASKKA